MKSNPVPQGVYGPSKAALLAVARDLANDLGPDGIRANTVVPSWMWGPNVKVYCQWQASERGVEPEDINELASANALRAMAADADVAEWVFFLSDRSSMITGQRLLVNAGEYFDVTVPALPAASGGDRRSARSSRARPPRPGAFVGDMIVYPGGAVDDDDWRLGPRSCPAPRLPDFPLPMRRRISTSIRRRGGGRPVPRPERGA